MDCKIRVGQGKLGRALNTVHGDRNSYRVVRRLAQGLHDQFRIPGPPFELYSLAASLGVRVIEGDIEAEGIFHATALRSLNEVEREEGSTNLLSAEGLFIPPHDNEAPLIILRKMKRGEGSSSIRRQHFTFAHELGHFVIRRDVSGCLDELPPDDMEEEALCNAFAAELLMPGFRLYPDLKKHGISPRALLFLSKRYDVSLQALLSQAISCFKGMVVVFLWTQGERGRPVNSWAAPTPYRGAILCDSGSSPIEKAFSSNDTEAGRCEILLDGKRSRWNAVALRLPGVNKVLSVLYRNEGSIHQYSPKYYRFASRQSRSQLKLPF